MLAKLLTEAQLKKRLFFISLNLIQSLKLTIPSKSLLLKNWINYSQEFKLLVKNILIKLWLITKFYNKLPPTHKNFKALNSINSF